MLNAYVCTHARKHVYMQARNNTHAHARTQPHTHTHTLMHANIYPNMIIISTTGEGGQMRSRTHIHTWSYPTPKTRMHHLRWYVKRTKNAHDKHEPTGWRHIYIYIYIYIISIRTLLILICSCGPRVDKVTTDSDTYTNKRPTGSRRGGGCGRRTQTQTQT